MGICLLVEWFAIQMPSTMVVWYSYYHLINGPVFRPPFEYRSVIEMPGTMVRGIWLANHLNNEQVKVCHSDVSVIQMFAIQIPTVFLSIYRSFFRSSIANQLLFALSNPFIIYVTRFYKISYVILIIRFECNVPSLVHSIMWIT